MDPYIQILITVGSLGGMLYGMLKFMLRDIHKELHEIKEFNKASEIKHNLASARIDHLYEETNRLYKTLIEMVKK